MGLPPALPQINKNARIDLRALILLLSALIAVFVLGASIFASYWVQRKMLVDGTLETNRVYATKLATMTEGYLGSALRQLAFSADFYGRHFGERGALTQENEWLRRQVDYFNSTFLVDATGVVRAVAPANLTTLGTVLRTQGATQALRERQPAVSAPYMSAAGNLVVVLSHPIFSPTNDYLGYVGGSIYLQRRSGLSQLLGEHYYKDGSYLYVVDRQLTLLYHPDPARVGTVVRNNPLLDEAVVSGGDGVRRVTNSYGVDMLAGYATVPSTGWVVVAQRPYHQTLAPLDKLILTMVAIALPLTVLGGGLIWWLTLVIVRPLRSLAAGARSMGASEGSHDVGDVRAWYVEAFELKRALMVGIKLLDERIGKLQRDVQTDPLTKLNNRRLLGQTLALWQAERRPFAAIQLDIDHFKKVNDTYGHEVGDQVLTALADVIRSCARAGDVLCRTGGEEFLVLLPDTDLALAAVVAERLRQRVADAHFPLVGQVTVSLGVAEWTPQHEEDASLALGRADKQLYLAKQRGRNCVSQEGATR